MLQCTSALIQLSLFKWTVGIYITPASGSVFAKFSYTRVRAVAARGFRAPGVKDGFQRPLPHPPQHPRPHETAVGQLLIVLQPLEI